MVVGLWGAFASLSANWFISASTMSAISCLSSAWCSPTKGIAEPTTYVTGTQQRERRQEDVNMKEPEVNILYIRHATLNLDNKILPVATFVLKALTQLNIMLSHHI